MRARVAGVILAAGLSTRMGTPKALLDWCGQPLVVYQIRQMQAAGADPVLVVTGHAAAAVEAVLAGTGATVVHNERYREGRASSVRTAAVALSDEPDAIVLLNVDQPRHAAVIARLIEEHTRQANLITVPAYAGRRGHPVVLSGRLLPELRLVSEADEGLKAVMRRHDVERQQVPFEDEEVVLDLNDPATYARALAGWVA